MVSSFESTIGGGRARFLARRWGCLSSLGFQFLYVIDGYAVDRDPARLHGFRNFPDQLDLEQAVVERDTLDLNVIRKAELPLEATRRDTAIEEISLRLVGLAPFDRDHILLSR